MSDPLNRAIDARLATYRPDAVPPFAAIEARKRARDRRRNSRVAALSALSAVGIVGVVFAGPSLTGSGDRLTGPQTAGPAASPTGTVGERPATRYGLRYVDPGVYDAGRDEPLATACLALPGTSEVSVDTSSPPGYSVLLTGTEQAQAFEQCANGLDNVAIRNLNPAPPGIDWDGVQVCRTRPDGPCRQLDAVTANRIYDALALDSRQRTSPAIRRCLVASVTYTLLFNHPGVDALEVSVPAASCLPVTVGSIAYNVDDAPRKLVRQAYGAAGDGRDPSSPCLTGAPTEPGYVGLTEQQARDLAAGQGQTVRIVGRDGTCAIVTTDLRADRVDLDLVSGQVANAARPLATSPKPGSS